MIRIKSRYDIEGYKAFNKYSSKGIFALAVICGISLLLVGVFLAFTSRRGFSIYLLIAILLPVSIYAYYKTKELEATRGSLIRNETYQIFDFDEEGFCLEQISSGNNFKDRYLYSDIYSIIKYKKYYFIYINRAQAFIIRNQDYIFGNEEEFDELLIIELKERFIKKGRHKRKKSLKP